MDSEAEHVDEQRKDDEADDTSSQMSTKNSRGHLGISKFAPEILNSVKSNESGDEESHKLDTGDKTNAKTSHGQPEEPLGLEAVAALAVELGPAESSGDSAKQEHRIEEDEAADCGIRILTEDHQSNKPDGSAAKIELLSSPIGHGNANSAPEGIELAHEGVVDIGGVGLA